MKNDSEDHFHNEIAEDISDNYPLELTLSEDSDA